MLISNNMKNKNLIIFYVGAAVLVGGIVYYSLQPGKLDEFAKCTKESGATFYGAFWCPHCQEQKKLFGKSMRLVNYIECSTPDGRDQKIICNQKNIEGYPTWEFSDGSRESGVLSMGQLSEKTGCSLPENTN